MPKMWWLTIGLKRRKERRMKENFFLQNARSLLQAKLIRGGRSLNVAKLFSLKELQEATNNFHSTMIIGHGAYATVYKGFFTDHKAIAIKKSYADNPVYSHLFMNELLILSSVYHRNLINLIGCCLETEVPLIVLEHISYGTLSALMQDKITRSSLNWNLRLKIAIEIANGLSYLHSARPTPIVHRDVKSSNIMIDQDFTAKVIGFGLSVAIPVDEDGISDLVKGTYGYLDPEYIATGKLTEKSDVYSFGVVLVELLTCIKVFSTDMLEEERRLPHLFLHRLVQGRLFEIVDEMIVSDESKEQLYEYSKLVQACLNEKGQDRPSMKEIAIVLEGLRFGGKQMNVASIILEGLNFDCEKSSDKVESDIDIDETKLLDDTVISEELVHGR